MMDRKEYPMSPAKVCQQNHAEFVVQTTIASGAWHSNWVSAGACHTLLDTIGAEAQKVHAFMNSLIFSNRSCL
jgi:hypothetical protein